MSTPKLFLKSSLLLYGFHIHLWESLLLIYLLIDHDKFGPFEGQLLIGDQGHSKIMRVFQEKVKGTYQGAHVLLLEKDSLQVFCASLGGLITISMWV